MAMLLLLGPVGVAMASGPTTSPLSAHLAHRLGGEWRTPNPDYEAGAAGGVREFGIRMRWGEHRQHVTGAIVGVGDAGEAHYQTIYVMYNPGTKSVIVQQVGWDGSYAHGEQPLHRAPLAPGDSETLDLTIHSPDGGMRVVRHVDTLIDPDTLSSEVFEHDGGDTWRLVQQWVWRRVDPSSAKP